MSHFKPLSDYFSVSPQVSVEDVQGAAQQGFKHIICNRPDNEDDGQPDFAEISKAALRLGLSAHHIPFDSHNVSSAVIDSMEKTIAALEGPVLAYCRSGTRCSLAWSALQRRKGNTFDQIESRTASAGYDLKAQREAIDALAKTT